MVSMAIISLSLIGTVLGLLLGLASRYLKVESDPMVDEIEMMLPGSQCGQCGFPGCRPAAEAVAKQELPADFCPPGGRYVAEQIANKLGISIDLSKIENPIPKLAVVREETCIGCTRCFKVCPTDAIVGAPKQLHTVIAVACTGCGNCVEVCPTGCLDLYPLEPTLTTWRWPKPQQQAA